MPTDEEGITEAKAFRFLPNTPWFVLARHNTHTLHIEVYTIPDSLCSTKPYVTEFPLQPWFHQPFRHPKQYLDVQIDALDSRPPWRTDALSPRSQDDPALRHKDIAPFKVYVHTFGAPHAPTEHSWDCFTFSPQPPHVHTRPCDISRRYSTVPPSPTTGVHGVEPIPDSVPTFALLARWNWDLGPGRTMWPGHHFCQHGMKVDCFVPRQDRTEPRFIVGCAGTGRFLWYTVPEGTVGPMARVKHVYKNYVERRDAKHGGRENEEETYSNVKLALDLPRITTEKIEAWPKSVPGEQVQQGDSETRSRMIDSLANTGGKEPSGLLQAVAWDDSLGRMCWFWTGDTKVHVVDFVNFVTISSSR
jgi:hypothetical protein